MKMWTCDIIKAMQKMEERIGYPFCIKSICNMTNVSSILIIETTDEEIYFYDSTAGALIGEG